MNKILLIFSGFSDDTFGLNNHICFDVDNCASGEPIYIRVYSPLEDNGFIVSGQYCPNKLSNWHIGISPLKDLDDFAPPNWLINFVYNREDNQMNLHIEAPDDVGICPY